MNKTGLIRKYRAFISYSHADRSWAGWIHHALESYRVPGNLVGTVTPSGPVPARLHPVFRDRDDLASAHDLSGRIQQAIDDSDNLVVICSPASARSPYVDKEVRAFKEQGRSDRIFCLIVDGDPGAAGTDDDCFVPALREKYDEHGNRDGVTEPIAADGRAQGDGRSLARLKLIAGILGLDLDDLRQRDLQRRNRRLAAIATGALAGLVVTALLAISAVVARNEADRRRSQAEDLLSFMVGDLRERLEPIGRLDILEQVGDKAMDYYAKVKLRELTDAELLRHAEVITQIGEIRVEQRQYDTALDSFLEAYRRSAEHVANNPVDGERWFNRGQTEFWVGYIHWLKGELPDAREWLLRYRDTSIELASKDSSRHDWALEVVYGHHNLAVLALEAGEIDRAEAAFRQEVQSIRRLQDKGLEDLDGDLADASSWLGNIALERGNLDEAKGYYEQFAAIARRLRDGAPQDTGLQYDWVNASLFLYDVASIGGDLDRAGRLLAEVSETLDGLVAHDPANLDWARSRAAVTIDQAYLAYRQDDIAAAESAARRGLRELERVMREAEDDVRSIVARGSAWYLLADINHALGNRTAAHDAVAKSYDALSSLRQTDRLNHIRRAALVNTCVLRSRIAARDGDTAMASAALSEARQILDAAKSDPGSPFIRDAHARMLAAAGDLEAAGNVVANLRDAGYSPLVPWPQPLR